MEGKEIHCTCKVIFSKVLLIAGIIVGALLTILGIVTITADTNDLFVSGTFLQWYRTDIYRITFSDSKGLSNRDIWVRPHQFIRFEWTTQTKKFVQECDDKYQPLKTGFRTQTTSTGSEVIALDNFTMNTHYYCVSHPDGVHCETSSSYQGRIHMFKATPFYTNGVLGNQNYRWTFFILAATMIAFGVVMILGELHVPLITTKFTFFYYSFVKGIIYVAIGFLVMGMSNVFGLFVAIMLWLLGIANCVYGWRSLTTFQWSKVGARGTTTIVTRREYI